MAATTHVIEIETGIGEPAFIPLVRGKELAPISIGRKGMWTVDSARVLEVHAFVYFDGEQLFMQSADETTPIKADGRPLPKTWTPVTAPCRLELGSASLVFRSLLEGAEAPPPLPPAPAADDVPRPKPARRSLAPTPTVTPTVATQVPPEHDYDDGGDTPAVSARPFAPGAFASHAPDDESTRLNPMVAPSSSRPGDMTPTRIPIPGAGDPMSRSTARMGGSNAPVGFNTMSRGLLTGSMQRPASFPEPAPVPPQSLMYGEPPPMAPGFGAPMPFQPAPHDMMGPPQGYAHDPSFGHDPNFGGGMAPTSPGLGGPMVRSPGQQSQVHTVRENGASDGSPLAKAMATFEQASIPKKILVILSPLLLLAVYVLFFMDDAPRPSRPGPRASTKAPVPSAPTAAPTAAPTVASTVVVAQPTGSAPLTQPTAHPQPAPTGHNTAAAKTLERQAVDALGMGELARAAAMYSQLAKEHPENPAYGEAARILTPRR
jgi:hypothetical protein